MDADSLDSQIIKTIDRLTNPLHEENEAPNCVSFQRILDEFATPDERKRIADRMHQLRDMNVISFYRTDPIIVTLTGEFHESLDDYSNLHIAEWRRRFYPVQIDPGKAS
jgi:hypothetical protein